MRDTFLKLLRPGLNYKKVFESQCRKKWNKWEKFCDEKDKDMDEYVKKQMKTDKSLTKDEALDMMELSLRLECPPDHEHSLPSRITAQHDVAHVA